jgi:hypothetical protein
MTSPRLMPHGKQMILAFALSLLPMPLMASPAETEQLCQWRAKLERIYHDSRLPPKKPFDQEFPPPVIQNLVAADLHKERVLEKVYGIKVTQEMLEEEIRRIEKDTKDAGTLARIKTTLGPDGQGFTETVVRPIIVERLLRLKFYQDKVIHAAEQEKAISSRRSMEAGNKIAGTEEQTWLLGVRPAEASAPAANIPPNTANSSAPSYTNQATAQIAQVMGGAGQEPKNTNHYFSDLDPELAAVLKTHLQKSGDISPIIEATSGFSIYQAMEITADHWKVQSVFIPRISYDDWLASQANSK